MRAGMYHDCIFNYIIQLLYGLFQFVQPVMVATSNRILFMGYTITGQFTSCTCNDKWARTFIFVTDTFIKISYALTCDSKMYHH